MRKPHREAPGAVFNKVQSEGWNPFGATQSGSYSEVTLDVRKNTVAKRASLLDIPRTQGEAKAFSRSIRLVNSDVAPPHTAVVPQVVVQVIVVNTKRDFGLGGCHFS